MDSENIKLNVNDPKNIPNSISFTSADKNDSSKNKEPNPSTITKCEAMHVQSKVPDESEKIENVSSMKTDEKSNQSPNEIQCSPVKIDDFDLLLEQHTILKIEKPNRIEEDISEISEISEIDENEDCNSSLNVDDEIKKLNISCSPQIEEEPIDFEMLLNNTSNSKPIPKYQADIDENNLEMLDSIPQYRINKNELSANTDRMFDEESIDSIPEYRICKSNNTLHDNTTPSDPGQNLPQTARSASADNATPMLHLTSPTRDRSYKSETPKSAASSDSNDAIMDLSLQSKTNKSVATPTLTNNDVPMTDLVLRLQADNNAANIHRQQLEVDRTGASVDKNIAIVRPYTSTSASEEPNNLNLNSSNVKSTDRNIDVLNAGPQSHARKIGPKPNNKMKKHEMETILQEFARTYKDPSSLRSFFRFLNEANSKLQHETSQIRNYDELSPLYAPTPPKCIKIDEQNLTSNMEVDSSESSTIAPSCSNVRKIDNDVNFSVTSAKCVKIEDSMNRVCVSDEALTAMGRDSTQLLDKPIESVKKTVSTSKKNIAKKDARTTSKRNTKTAKKNYCEQSSDDEGFTKIQIAPTIAKRPGAGGYRRVYGASLTKDEEKYMQIFKESKVVFLQNVPCTKLPSTVTKCRECRQRDAVKHATGSIFCRFYEFRCLQYNDAGKLQVSGFSNPYTDPTEEDLRIWFPDSKTFTQVDLDLHVCRFILLHVGDQFCYLWRQESEAILINQSTDQTIGWKKVVRGVREICDVCDTTLFNFHWTCRKCGFGVCIDCYKDRKNKRSVRTSLYKTAKGRDEYYWLMCTFRDKHKIEDLMLTQIVAGNSLNKLGELMHKARAIFKIPLLCDCMLTKAYNLLIETEIDHLIYKMIKETPRKPTNEEIEIKKFEENLKIVSYNTNNVDDLLKRFKRSLTFERQKKFTRDPISYAYSEYKGVSFLREGLAGPRRFFPPKIMTHSESEEIAPGLPHQWLCDGKILRLADGKHPDGRELFQEVWKCGQPVIVSNVSQYLNLDLWRPEAFCEDFGEKENDLVNCLNGNLVPNQPMKHFWEGFQCIKKRLLDAKGVPMLLKLKDWPPGDDFAEILPARYEDLMRGLPMPEYTLRTGELNIASSLPDIFVRPDLGPKMYNAYGSALHPDKGTTNLHLDISDAVNIMVYVGIPTDSNAESQIKAAYKSIDRGGCDYYTRWRVRQPGILPGALWHIFPARDADKIRDLLNRVTIEKGYRLEADHDPIHDQNWYLDDNLRGRLYDEYGVEGYAIVQCLGDSVFIPAGAPHQVQNLHNCIKVAEDFVSPENITHCYHLTHEFRRLSSSHSNHEDKLQIKNIIFHAVKDCTITLMRLVTQKVLQDEKESEGKLVSPRDSGAYVTLSDAEFELISSLHKNFKVLIETNCYRRGDELKRMEDDDEVYECDINQCKEILQAEYEVALAESAGPACKPIKDFGAKIFAKLNNNSEMSQSSDSSDTLDSFHESIANSIIEKNFPELVALGFVPSLSKVARRLSPVSAFNNKVDSSLDTLSDLQLFQANKFSRNELVRENILPTSSSFKKTPEVFRQKRQLTALQLGVMTENGRRFLVEGSDVFEVRLNLEETKAWRAGSTIEFMLKGAPIRLCLNGVLKK